VDVGAHTKHHPILALTSERVAWDEIAGSRNELQEAVGRPILHFAYPNGVPGQDFGAEHVRMVKEAGFSGAVSTASGAADRRSDLFQLPRFTPWGRPPLKFDLMMLKNLVQGREARVA
jgi:peptidoglycan/xylan/chitin deacetylase (PgdA/CDA1 family)